MATQYPNRELNLPRNRIQGNGLLQERFSASYANTNPNFVFQNIPEGLVGDAVLLSILQVMDNILCRGTITPPSAFVARMYFDQVLSDNPGETCVDFEKWNEGRQKFRENRICTYDRDIPQWGDTIQGGSGPNGDAAERFFHEILPEWFPKVPVAQLIRPEVRFDEITENTEQRGYSECRADFYLEQAQLVIEIDGKQHLNQSAEDAARDRFLCNRGLRVIRIPADDVENTKYRNYIQKRIDEFGLKTKFDRYADLARERENYSLRRKLDTILRFELLLISLMKHGVLRADAQCWKLALRDMDTEKSRSRDMTALFRTAHDDICIWFEKIASMCGYAPKLPEVDFCRPEEADAVIDFAYNKYWTDEALLYPETIYVRNDHFENCSYFEVQNGERIPFQMHHLDMNCEPQLLFFLRNFFGYTQFKEGQHRIICRALSGNDTIGILPTGSGKSLCYQLVGLLQPGVTMSVCPIISLIQDQKRNLDLFGIDHTFALSSENSPQEKGIALKKLRNLQISFIWISPERFQIQSFRDELCEIGKSRSIKYAVLDEVHCMSEWGHDFRTSYLVLVDTIRQYCGSRCALYGLTATASDFVLKDILKIFRADQSIVVSSEHMHRPELSFHVVPTRGSSRKKVLWEVLRGLQEKYRDRGNIFEPHGKDSICGIIFTVYANGKEFGSSVIAGELNLELSKAEGEEDKSRNKEDEKEYVACYNGGMNPKVKQHVQTRYMNNEIPLLVATKAFGMGINKPNVRYTIHQSLPWSSEAFYQEAGRAGRSSDPAEKESDCYIIYTPEKKENVLKELFGRDTPVQRVKELSLKMNADLRPILYLWGLNNESVDEELKRMQMTLEYLQRGNTDIHCDEKKNKDKWEEEKGPVLSIKGQDGDDAREELQSKGKTPAERTLYRLSLLGFVSDWTIEYPANIITVKCTDNVALPKEEDILDHLYAYIRRYDPKFTLESDSPDYEVYRRINDRKDMFFVERYMRILLQWTEANIIYNRKTSIANMISDIDNSNGDGERLKELIEKRFVIVREESALAKVQNYDMDVNTWIEAIENPDKDTTIAVLQRHIETNQNNHAANFVLSMLQLLTNRKSAYGLESYLTSSLKSLKNEQDRRSLTEFAVKAAGKSRISEANLDTLGGCFAKIYPEYARYIHRELGDKGSLCIILAEQLDCVRKIGGAF